jgi:hypothetical protein
LHARGFAHGRIEGDSVIAVGEQIKLRMDCAHRLTPGAPFENASAQDVRQIGELVARSLTRRRIAGENDPAIQLLPAPFSAVVRRAISGHGTVGELATLAGLPSPYAAFAARPNAVPVPISKPGAAPAPGVARAENAPATPAKAETAAKPAPPPVVPSAAVPKPAPAPAAGTPRAASFAPTLGPTVSDAFAAVSPIEGVAPAAAEVSPAAGQPLSARTPLSARAQAKDADAGAAQSSLLFDEEDKPRQGMLQRRSAPYLIGAAAILVLLVLLLFHWLGGHKKSAATADAPNAPAATAPANIPPQDLPKPQAARSAPVVPAAAEGNAAAAAPVAPGWRVIAYTYNHRPDAEHKVDQIATKHPQLHPVVFAPRAGHGPYLVELGGPMSRDQAARLQQLARKMGMPRDTYIRNYR